METGEAETKIQEAIDKIEKAIAGQENAINAEDMDDFTVGAQGSCRNIAEADTIINEVKELCGKLRKFLEKKIK